MGRVASMRPVRGGITGQYPASPNRRPPGRVPEPLSRSAGRPSAWLSLPPQTEGQALAFGPLMAISRQAIERHPRKEQK